MTPDLADVNAALDSLREAVHRLGLANDGLRGQLEAQTAEMQRQRARAEEAEEELERLRMLLDKNRRGRDL